MHLLLLSQDQRSRAPSKTITWLSHHLIYIVRTVAKYPLEGRPCAAAPCFLLVITR